MIGGRKKSWFKGGERTRKARGMEPISLGFRRTDGRVCLLPLVTHWACLCGRIGSRLERSLDRRNESIGPPITTVIGEVIERRLAALSDCFRVPPDTD